MSKLQTEGGIIKYIPYLKSVRYFILVSSLAAVPDRLSSILTGVSLLLCLHHSVITLPSLRSLCKQHVIERNSHHSSFLQGWIDNFNGTSGVFIAVCLVTI